MAEVGAARRRSTPCSPGGWRDLVTILHPPYTAWHLSYVALGAAAAPVFHAVRLWAALGAFFLAVGIAAHALDELNGHPLGTRLSDRTLAVLAGVALAGAVGIGIAGLFVVSFTLLPFVLAGAFGVVAYNLELFGGRFHTRLLVRRGVGRLSGAHRLLGHGPGNPLARRGGRRGRRRRRLLRAQRGAAAAVDAGARAAAADGLGRAVRSGWPTAPRGS